MAENPCEVPMCPALAEVGRATCGVHRDARLASELRISESASGRGGTRCLECRRKFKATDWCYKNLRPLKQVKHSGERFGHAHVQCEPPTPKLSRKAIRESVKPLLEVGDDIARDRGAA